MAHTHVWKDAHTYLSHLCSQLYHLIAQFLNLFISYSSKRQQNEEIRITGQACITRVRGKANKLRDTLKSNA